MTQVIRPEIPYLNEKNMKLNSQLIRYSMMKLKRKINLAKELKNNN